MKINPAIFKAYDIRGHAPSEINEDVAERIGIAYGNFLDRYSRKNKLPVIKKVLVSRDHRRSGIAIKRGFIRGLRKTGKNIIDMGVACTPQFYFALCKFRLNAGCQITASHNPKEYNGIKFNLKDAMPLSGEAGIYEIRDCVVNGSLETILPELAKNTTISRIDVEEDYINYLSKKCKIKRPLKIVIDTGNGVVSLVPQKVLTRIGCDVKTLYSKPDDRFPNHPADPHDYKSLKDLQKEVIAKKADLGIAFDGDGDRVGVVDEKGRIVYTDKLIMLLARKVLKKKKGNIVYEVRVSDAVLHDTKKHGGKVIICRAGHSYLLNKIIDNNAVFGAELSGHIYYPLENYPYDDGLFSAMKIVEVVSRLNFLSEYIDSMPQYYASPEVFVRVKDSEKFDRVNGLVKLLRKNGYKVNTIDGAKVRVHNAWALVRASNTTSHIKCRFEGRTKDALQKIFDIMRPFMVECGINIRKNL